MRRILASLLLILAALALAVQASAAAPPTGAANLPAGFCGTCTKTDTVWATFQSDVNAASAGQTICWNGANVTNETLGSTAAGTAAAPINVCNINGSTDTFTTANDGIGFSASHVHFYGWTMTGNDSGSGFGVVNFTTGLDDVAFKYNTISHFGFSGIQENNTDCVDIEYNTVFHNASTGGSGAGGHGSNISVYEPATEAACTATWPINISNNLTYGALNPSGGYDGNGIIIDSLTNVSYTKHVLVANNIGYGNFGGCVKDYNVATANDLQIVNNDCYLDQLGNSPLSCRGEIANEAGSGVITAGNNAIVYSSNVTGDTCIDNGCASTPTEGGNACGNYYPTSTQSYFNSPTTDFTEKSGSATIGAGVSGAGIIVPGTDIAGITRGATFDVGAYNIATATPTATPTGSPSPTATPTATPTPTLWEFVNPPGTGLTSNAFITGVTSIANAYTIQHANDLVFVSTYCGSQAGTVGSDTVFPPADAFGSTWHALGSPISDGANIKGTMFWAQIGRAGADAITQAFSPSCDYPRLFVEEHYVPPGDTVFVDGTPTGQGSIGVNVPNASPGTTSVFAPDLFVGFIGQWATSNPLAPDSVNGWSLGLSDGSSANNFTLYEIYTSPVTLVAQANGTAPDWFALGGAFAISTPTPAPTATPTPAPSAAHSVARMFLR